MLRDLRDPVRVLADEDPPDAGVGDRFAKFNSIHVDQGGPFVPNIDGSPGQVDLSGPDVRAGTTLASNPGD